MPRVPAQASIENLFAALADRTRLRLLNLMAGQEVCVCYFVELLGAPQPTISRHLAYLRKAGLVSARREGKWMHYRLHPPADPTARKVLSECLRWAGEEKEMMRDRARLQQACCSPQRFTQLEGAPAPRPAK